MRDEESETQRKAHAKRVRETRRSTQGVTLDEIKSAEQLVKKKQQQNNDPPTTTAPSTQVEYCLQFIGRLCKHSRNIHFYNAEIKQQESLDIRFKKAPYFHTLKTNRHFLPADNIELVTNFPLKSNTTYQVRAASRSCPKNINPAFEGREKESNVSKFRHRMANTVRNYFRRETFFKFTDYIRNSKFKSKIFSFKSRSKDDAKKKFVSPEIFKSDSEKEVENEEKLFKKSKGSIICSISRIFKILIAFVTYFGLAPGS